MVVTSVQQQWSVQLVGRFRCWSNVVGANMTCHGTNGIFFVINTWNVFEKSYNFLGRVDETIPIVDYMLDNHPL